MKPMPVTSFFLHSARHPTIMPYTKGIWMFIVPHSTNPTDVARLTNRIFLEPKSCKMKGTRAHQQHIVGFLLINCLEKYATDNVITGVDNDIVSSQQSKNAKRL